MSELGWREAVRKVLSESDEAMHYTRIAEVIAEKKLRKNFGANPATSVNVAISDSLKWDGANSPFIRISPGIYWLKEAEKSQEASHTQEVPPVLVEAGLINAFGMFWARNAVLWKSTPKILGQQQQNSSTVDFASQTGVYLLYDGRQVIYVGRAIEQSLGARLQQHTVDRLNGRWDRFSWFGIYSVSEEGQLKTGKAETFGIPMLVATMEALLIEGLEPPQNRKGGDRFRASEFLQVQDPELEKRKMQNLVDEWKKKL